MTTTINVVWSHSTESENVKLKIDELIFSYTNPLLWANICNTIHSSSHKNMSIYFKIFYLYQTIVNDSKLL